MSSSKWEQKMLKWDSGRNPTINVILKCDKECFLLHCSGAAIISAKCSSAVLKKFAFRFLWCHSSFWIQLVFPNRGWSRSVKESRMPKCQIQVLFLSTWQSARAQRKRCQKEQKAFVVGGISSQSTMLSRARPSDMSLVSYHALFPLTLSLLRGRQLL